MSETGAEEPKTCPRCGAAFDCEIVSPGDCQCSGIQISKELTSHLFKTWGECLCAHCLRELAEAEQRSEDAMALGSQLITRSGG